MHNHIIQHESSSYQLEQESKAHDQRVGWQEVLSTSDHEGPHCQILACRSSLGDLSSTQPLSVLVLLLPYTCLTNYNKETQQQHNLQPPCRTSTKAFCKVAANIAAAVSLHAMQTAPLPHMLQVMQSNACCEGTGAPDVDAPTKPKSQSWHPRPRCGRRRHSRLGKYSVGEQPSQAHGS